MLLYWQEFCCKFLGEYNSERVVKIGQHFQELWTARFFRDTVYKFI